MSDGPMSLMVTSTSRSRWRAIHTDPMPPRASGRVSSYRCATSTPFSGLIMRGPPPGIAQFRRARNTAGAVLPKLGPLPTSTALRERGRSRAVRTPPEEWPFSPYEKIAESLAAWLGEDEAAHRALRGAEWIVTEKIHGANLCLVTDGVTIRAAKRKAFISPGDDFFGHRAVVDRLAPAVLHLADLTLAREGRATLV